MARKTKRIVIAADNRDKGKLFKLTEMSALDAELWAADAMFGLAQSGVELPDDFKTAGMPAIVMLGFKALGRMQPAMYRDLMERLMACVTHYPSPDRREISRGYGSAISTTLFDTDIEEVSTRLMLKAEVFSLMTGFTLPAALSLNSSTATGQN